MNRRTFLVSLIALLLPFRKSQATPKAVHPLYGEYASHHCANNIGHMELCLDDLRYPPVSQTTSSLFRYVNFPIETTLTVRMDKFEFRYTAFNGSQQLCDKINQMSPVEIVRLLPLDAGKEIHDIDFADNGSILRELHPEAISVQDPGHRTVKFRMASVSLLGNK
jgi:hypothetical protein